MLNDGYDTPIVCFVKFSRNNEQKPTGMFEIMFMEGDNKEQKQRFEAYIEHITPIILVKSVKWIDTVKCPDRMKTQEGVSTTTGCA